MISSNPDPQPREKMCWAIDYSWSWETCKSGSSAQTALPFCFLYYFSLLAEVGWPYFFSSCLYFLFIFLIIFIFLFFLILCVYITFFLVIYRSCGNQTSFFFFLFFYNLSYFSFLFPPCSFCFNLFFSSTYFIFPFLVLTLFVFFCYTPGMIISPIYNLWYVLLFFMIESKIKYGTCEVQKDVHNFLLLTLVCQCMQIYPLVSYTCTQTFAFGVSARKPTQEIVRCTLFLIFSLSILFG